MGRPGPGEIRRSQRPGEYRRSAVRRPSQVSTLPAGRFGTAHCRRSAAPQPGTLPARCCCCAGQRVVTWASARVATGRTQIRTGSGISAELGGLASSSAKQRLPSARGTGYRPLLAPAVEVSVGLFSGGQELAFALLLRNVFSTLQMLGSADVFPDAFAWRSC